MRFVYKIVQIRHVDGRWESVCVDRYSRFYRTYAIGKKTKGEPGAPLFAYDSPEAVRRYYPHHAFSGSSEYRLLKCVATRPHRIPEGFRKGFRALVTLEAGCSSQEQQFVEFFANRNELSAHIDEGVVFCGAVFPVEEVHNA